MLKQQIIGVVNLSLPLIVLFQFYPHIFFMWQGQLLLACVWAVYITYLNKKQADALAASLLYVPTQDYKQSLESIIESCGMNADSVALRYGYTHEQLAMTINNTLVIDPVFWHGYENDAPAQAVVNIFNTHIAPTLQPLAQKRHELLKQALTPGVQRFIFKHELGHINNRYSTKKLAVIGITGFIATYVAITAALAVLPINGLRAIFVSMTLGGTTGLLCTYLSNVLFKLSQEKGADLFAVKNSNAQDIEEAALFFEKHQTILDMHKEQIIFAQIPSIVLTGHMNGFARAAYLRSQINHTNQ